MSYSRLHITHIIPTLSFGGAERFVVDLVNNSPESVKHSIILLRDEKPLAEQLKSEVDVYVVEKKGKISLGLFGDLKKKLTELKPDIVHTHLFGGDFWGRVTAHSLKIPVVTTEHNVNVDESIWKRLIKFILRNFTEIYTCPSKAVSDFMKKNYKITKPIEVIRHGIDLEHFSMPSARFEDREARLLLLGRLHRQKGIDIALKALESLKQEDWTLDIVGSGEEEGKIKELIKNYDLDGKVKLYPATADVPEVLKNHDIMLVPSRWEGLGIVIMEAMTAGRVVIGSRVGGIPELIEDGKTGFLVEPENSDELAKQILYCLNNRESCREVAENARKYAMDNFGVGGMVEAYLGIYGRLNMSV